MADQHSEDYRAGFEAGVSKTNQVYQAWAKSIRRSAEKTRKEGTWNNGWPFYKEFTARKWEECAKSLESAADALDKIRTEVAEQLTPEDKLPDSWNQ